MTDPRIRERRVAVARAAGRRRLRFLIIGAGVVALIVGALVALHSSLFSARHIKIIGGAGVSRRQVILTSGLGGAPPLIDIDPAQAVSNLERLPTVATASVSLRWPDSVDIRLTGRVGVAAVPLGGSAAGRVSTVAVQQQFAVVDATGRVLAILRQAPAGLPIVLAASFVGHPGTFLKPAGRALIDVARSLGGLAAKVRAVGYDQSGQIALSLKSGQVAIVTGPGQLAQKMVSLATVLHDVSLTNIATVDLSYPSSPVLTPIGAGRSVVLVQGG